MVGGSPSRYLTLGGKSPRLFGGNFQFRLMARD
jgi:hypothetical protein